MEENEKEALCKSCGACCAAYRVSFYWRDAEILGIPPHLTEPVNSLFVCMSGTNTPSPHCQALEGVVGQNVKCTIYSNRPSPCHEVEIGDEKCQQARAKYGLPPVLL